MSIKYRHDFLNILTKLFKTQVMFKTHLLIIKSDLITSHIFMYSQHSIADPMPPLPLAPATNILASRQLEPFLLQPPNHFGSDLVFPELVPAVNQLADNPVVLLQGVQPDGVGVIGVDAPVPLGEVSGQDVLVQRLAVVAVEEYSRLHLRVEQRLEDAVHLVEHPGVVDDVDRVRVGRKA